MDSHRKSRLIGVLLACLATRAAGDNPCPPWVWSNAQLPLQGNFPFSPDSYLNLGESVALSGWAHVVTKLDPTSFVGNVDLNMSAIGVGQTSGDLYIAIGRYQRQGTAIPPGLNIFTPKFTLEPTRGGTSVQLPLKFTLDFNKDGTLNVAASTVSIGGVP